jgi:hypothetical protein
MGEKGGQMGGGGGKGEEGVEGREGRRRKDKVGKSRDGLELGRTVGRARVEERATKLSS